MYELSDRSWGINLPGSMILVSISTWKLDKLSSFCYPKVILLKTRLYDRNKASNHKQKNPLWQFLLTELGYWTTGKDLRTEINFKTLCNAIIAFKFWWVSITKLMTYFEEYRWINLLSTTHHCLQSFNA